MKKNLSLGSRTSWLTLNENPWFDTRLWSGNFECHSNPEMCIIYLEMSRTIEKDNSC